jgi:succinate-semialdehyde dehydrogenase/glutarate-semialdehyde dehydrogenase
MTSTTMYDETFAAIPTGLLIDGKNIEADAGNSFAVIDPADGSTIAHVADGSVGDGIRAMEAAAAAAAAWAATSPRHRSDVLMRCYQEMIERKEWFAELISLENGKAMRDARSEVVYAAEFFRWYAEEAVRVLGEIGISPSGNNKILVHHQPIGVAVLVTPWNFPAAMATRKIGPALAAGCTCVLKPAAETPLTALAIGELMMRAGVPAGVVNIVTTSAAGPVVSAMLHHPKARKLSFTGSTKVGKILLREAADQVINCSMELGGNSPFIVMECADLEEAVEGAMAAKMRNGGEACTAANRFFVHHAIYDRFVGRFCEEMAKVKTGRGRDSDVECGPLITKAAVQKVDSLVSEAIHDGARPVLGGKAADEAGYFYPPTVLADVLPSSRILQEEIFGPVGVIVKVANEEEAITLANDTEYGLVAYVYCGDLKRALRISDRLECGMVGINKGVVSDVAAPFGGTKQSGLGREGSHHGIMEFLEPKYVAVSW